MSKKRALVLQREITYVKYIALLRFHPKANAQDKREFLSSEGNVLFYTD